MEKVCPVCNKLETKTYMCKKCNGTMTDKGIMQEYFDDYTANMAINDSKEYCVHIFQCNNCDFFERVRVDKITI